MRVLVPVNNCMIFGNLLKNMIFCLTMYFYPNIILINLQIYLVKNQYGVDKLVNKVDTCMIHVALFFLNI